MKPLLPVFNWIGCKHSYRERLSKYLPQQDWSKTVYYEPFLGTGSMLLNIRPAKAFIGDVDKDIVAVFRALKNQCKSLCQILHDLEQFESTRDVYNELCEQFQCLSGITRCAAFIFISRHTFASNMTRNQQGGFRKSFRTTPVQINYDNMHEVGKYLHSNHINITHGDYSTMLTSAKAGDFIFLDPPYITARNDTYYQNTVDADALLHVIGLLHKRKCKIMMVNSYSCYLKKHLLEFKCFKLPVKEKLLRISGASVGRLEAVYINYTLPCKQSNR